MGFRVWVLWSGVWVDRSGFGVWGVRLGVWVVRFGVRGCWYQRGTDSTDFSSAFSPFSSCNRLQQVPFSESTHHTAKCGANLVT